LRDYARFGLFYLSDGKCDYKIDGKEKVFQTIEMFRAIVKNLANEGEAESA
jgi:hypothetical protein